MDALSTRITTALNALIGKPIGDCWRIANMQIFEFGSRHKTLNRKGEEIEVSDWKLHIQCRWRMTDGTRIIFGSDDRNYPADPAIPIEEFDGDKQPSVLEATQIQWFKEHRERPLKVIEVRGDDYGGFRIRLEGGFTLEAFACDSCRDEYSQHWRFFEQDAGSHFVVTGYGIEGEDEIPGCDRRFSKA